jgi:hypothetical protein
LTPDARLQRRQVQLVLKWASIGVHNPTRELADELERAMGLAGEQGDGDAALRAACWMGWVEYALGNQRVAVEHYERCVRMAADAADSTMLAQLHANIGMSRAMATDYDAARAGIEGVLSQRDAVIGRSSGGQPGSIMGGAGLGYAMGTLALLEADQGAFDAALSRLSAAREAVGASGKLAMQGSVEIIASLVHGLRGEWGECRAAAERAAAMAERTGGIYQRHMARALRGQSRFHGDGDEAGIELMREAAIFLDENGIGLTLSWNHASLAEALALSGQHDGALVHAARALSRAEQWDALGEATAHRARAIALGARGEDYAPSLRRSLAVAERKHSPREAALAQLRWAELDRRHGRRRDDAPTPAELSRTLREMGMKSYAERADALR